MKNTRLLDWTKPLSRYLLFYGDKYYPSGGMEDFKKDFDTTEDAIIWLDEYVKANKIYVTVEEEWKYRWAHIYDFHQRKIVWKH